MSALQQQHDRWATARGRLGLGKVRRMSVPPAPKRTIITREVAAPRVPPLSVEPQFGAPLDMLWLPSPKTILRLVSLKYRVPIDEIAGPRRGKRIVRIRHEAIALVYQHCPQLSLPAIGRWFQRDHTTILHALRKMGVYEGSDARLFPTEASIGEAKKTHIAAQESCCSMEDRQSNYEAVA